MPLIGTHIVSGLILKKTIKTNQKNSFALILGTIAPDFDFIIHFLIGSFHRTFTHSILFLTLIMLCSLILHKKELIYFLIGNSVHILLDIITGDKVLLLYPLKYGFGLNLLNFQTGQWLILDSFIITLILIYLWIQNKDIFK